MDAKLIKEGIVKLLSGLILVGMLLFLPAGTFAYRNGWLFIGLLFVPMLILGIVLLLKAPDLLRKRLSVKEKQGEQKWVIGLSGLVFLAGFLLAGLDHRYGWSDLPEWIVILASVLFLIAYGLYAEVMRENAYLSRTVEIQEDQKVIDTGLYGIIRHPMYTAAILLFLSMPIVLGSWVSLLVFLAYPILMVLRIRNEEKILEEGLAGYKEYKERVKWRLVPFIW